MAGFSNLRHGSDPVGGSCGKTTNIRTVKWRRKCLCVAAVLPELAWPMSPERFRACERAAEIGVAEAAGSHLAVGVGAQGGRRRGSRASATWSRFAFSTNRRRSEPWLHATNFGQPTTDWRSPKPQGQWPWAAAGCCPRPLRPLQNHCGRGRAWKRCPTGGKSHVPAA